MRRFTRLLCVFVVLQAACLAVGLWIHDRFLISQVRWTGHSPKTNDLGQALRPVEGTASARQQPGPQASQSTGVGNPRSEESDRLVRALVPAGILAFFWTLGLQSGVAYFLLTRIDGEHSRQQSKSNEQTLQHTQDLVRTRDAVIFGLAKLSESRDPETGHHLERISLYSMRLAAALSRHPKYREVVTPAFVRLLGISSALHDIGKVGIEDSVLLKPGVLTSTERFRMQLHAEVGAQCIRDIERRLGRSNFLEMARQIAYSHHEHWDGTGYPQGLAGEAIPLAARIVAIADVYDALSVRRIYKDPYPHAECVSMIRDESGRHFDPELVEVFLKIEHQFEEIAARFAEGSHGAADQPLDDERASAAGTEKATGEETGSWAWAGAGRRMTAQQQEVLLATLAACDLESQATNEFITPGGAQFS